MEPRLKSFIPVFFVNKPLSTEKLFTASKNCEILRDLHYSSVILEQVLNNFGIFYYWKAMVSIVPSRFAGLRIEDDDDDYVKPKQKQKNTLTQKTTSGNNQKQTGNQGQQSNQKKPKPVRIIHYMNNNLIAHFFFILEKA